MGKIKIKNLPDRIDILAASERRRRMLAPVVIDGRKFTEELVATFGPYHRKLPASVERRETGVVVSVREIPDVHVGMRVAIAGDAQAWQITGIGVLKQEGKDAADKPIEVVFTELHCRAVEEGGSGDAS